MRLGQTRTVTLARFVMRDTVEERLYRALASHRAAAATAAAETTVLERSRVGAPIERRFRDESDLLDLTPPPPPALPAPPPVVVELADGVGLCPASADGLAGRERIPAALHEAGLAPERRAKRPRVVVEIDDDDDDDDGGGGGGGGDERRRTAARGARGPAVSGSVSRRITQTPSDSEAVLSTALCRSLEVSAPALALCTAMGFGEAAAKAALVSVDNDVERAVSLLLRA